MADVLLPDGVAFDFDRSTITLAGQAFPAVIMLWPHQWSVCDGVCASCTEAGCTYGGAAFTNFPDWSRGWTVLVPMENGVCMIVSYERNLRRGLDDSWLPDDDAPPSHGIVAEVVSRLLVDARFTALADSEQRLGPCRMAPNKGRIGVPKPWWAAPQWDCCDPEWLAETIVRLSRYPVDPPSDGVATKLLPIGHPLVKPRVGT